MTEFEPVIGLEVHCQLKTATKMFSGATTVFGREPNSQVDTVSLGLPGALPVINGRAVELAVRAARTDGLVRSSWSSTTSASSSVTERPAIRRCGVSTR